MMHRWLVVLLVAGSPLAAAAQSASLVDRIVAVVNKEVITFSELSEAVAAAHPVPEKVPVPLSKPLKFAVEPVEKVKA